VKYYFGGKVFFSGLGSTVELTFLCHTNQLHTKSKLSSTQFCRQ